MKPINIELAVIGAGPAGLAAAVRAKEEGIKDLVVFERDERPGGILHQCIHTGFGLIKFNKDLTGPEYAHIFISELEKLKIPVELNSMVMEINTMIFLQQIRKSLRIQISFILVRHCVFQKKDSVG